MSRELKVVKLILSLYLKDRKAFKETFQFKKVVSLGTRFFHKN